MSDKDLNLPWDNQGKEVLASEKVVGQKQKDLSDTLGEKENNEQKESIEDLSKLEKENFRIDSTWWKEIVDDSGVAVKENPEWDVREYLEWKCKWEQLFTKASAIREAKKVGKRLPSSCTVIKDIIEWKKEAGWYKLTYRDFLAWENIKFPGWRNPKNKKFNNIDKGFGIWCDDGSYFIGNRLIWHLHDDDNVNYGFSVRCLQD